MAPSVVMVIAHHGFRDEEYWVPKHIFETSGIAVTTASSELSPATSKSGETTPVDILLSDIRGSAYQAIIFIGGPGASEYFDNPDAHRLARELMPLSPAPLLCAICIAPVILCRAGVLTGKQATVFPSGAAELQASGVNYTGNPVETDGNIITGSGPEAADAFSKKIVKRLREM